MSVAGQGATTNRPPLIPRGIQKPKSNRVVIDWFEFTLDSGFVDSNRYKSLQTYLRYDSAKFTHAPRGMMGYRSQMLYGPCRILYDGTEEMGCHIILSGDAIRAMQGDLLKFIHWVLHQGGKVTRIDLALDDVSGALKISKVKKHVRSGAMVCRSRGYRYMRSGEIGGEMTGETVYFGSPSSRTQYRIYDKAKESKLDGHWVRCEGQYRQENAHQVAQHIHEAGFEVGKVFSGLLRGYLRFLQPAKIEKKKTRWAVVNWWENLLMQTETLMLSIQKGSKTIEKSRKWFIEQVAPTFAMLLNYFGADAMEQIYKNGYERLSKKQKLLVRVPF